MKVGVIGSGSIGPDLAYGFLTAVARQGGTVVLHDVRPEALDAGRARIENYMEKAVARGKLSAREAGQMRERLVTSLDLGALADRSYVLEAATENLETKRVILESLEAVVAPDCLIGFATSGLPRARIAAGARHPERCFVNHPFYPAWRALPIEVVLSGDEALGQRMLRVLRALGKVPIVTADVACFAADDIFVTYCAEAVRLLVEGVATPAQIDAVVDAAVGGGGPFLVMDLTRGNPLNVHCLELMRDAPTGSPWFEPPPIFKVQGVKPWHQKGQATRAACAPAVAAQIRDRILAVLLARTYFVADRAICEPSDLDWLTRNALGFSPGLLDLANRLGADEVHRVVTHYAAAHPGFEVPRSIAEKKLIRFARDIQVERRGPVAVVSIRRPEVRNALSARTLRELDEACTALLADAAVDGLVLTSFDGALAGADIGELAALPDPAACEAICHVGHAILGRLAAAKKPVVAALDGPVLGGGAELSMACHARVVGRDLQLGQPEVNLGIIPGYGGTQRLPRLVGVERAAELLRTGRTLGAAEACAWGWARGEPVDDPVAAAVALVGQAIAGKVKLAPLDPAPLPPLGRLPELDLGHRSLAIDAILVEVLREGLRRPLPEGLAIEARGFGRCKATVDMDIGMKNFVQNGPRVPAAFLHE
jgi:enoyl-CoA hydratase/3-hydroxyacyl-CoA dehydrogenase